MASPGPDGATAATTGAEVGLVRWPLVPDERHAPTEQTEPTDPTEPATGLERWLATLPLVATMVLVNVFLLALLAAVLLDGG